MKNIKAKEKFLEIGLYIIATPIGNLGDISERAIFVMKELDFIICENPKHSSKLLNKFGIKKKLIALHDYNEKEVINKISKHQYNSRIGLISDAGSPLISDPGYKLVKDYIDKKIFVTSVPGPSSVIASIQLSGMPTNNFAFFGFLPKSNKKIDDLLENIENTKMTSVVFVSGKNLKNLIKKIVNIDEKKTISICKELTKINELIYRETSESIYKKLLKNQINTKGEFVVILPPRADKKRSCVNSKINSQISILLKKFTLTEAVRIVHNLTEISKKEIYAAAIKIKND